MNLSSATLPPHISRLMPAAMKKELGVDDWESAQIRLAAREEKQLQKQLTALLRLHGIEADASAMHKKTTRKVGEPDFKFAVRVGGITSAICWEAKRPGEKLRPEQEVLRAKLEASPNGWKYYVIHTVAEAVEVLRELKVIK